VRWTKTELVEVYSKHPLQEKTILERLRRQRKDLNRLTELDLAVDEKTEITDQNHIGGLRFTEELAQAAGITSASRVLDLGSGLGGSARVIANLCPCSIQGIELTRSRYNDAVSLTQRLGMADQIRFICGDFLTEDLPNGSYDVIVAQATLAHFPDKKEVLDRCARLLKSDGRLAVEEAYLVGNGWNDQAREQLRVLENCWKSYLMPLNEWLAQSAMASLTVIVNQDLTSAFVNYYSGLLRKTTRAPRGTVTEQEVQGWKNGLALADAGLLLYVRTVAKKI
jgi:SAM-dependent methyltransferase